VNSRILVVDDDVELCQLIREYVANEPWDVECVHDGAEGLDRALTGEHRLVILDIMLPGMSGLDVLRRLREKRHTPVLMLTARGEDVDRIVGLELGADDYLPKPFNPREMVARVRAILRRADDAPESDRNARPVAVGDLRLDPSQREVTRDGVAVPLTAVEFDLLRVLMLSAGRIVGRDDLSRSALGRPWNPYDRAIDMHVSNLRRKLGSAASGRERIKTVRSSGYLLAREDGA
jgi:two-component system, OmpR family, response regulator CpxR